LRAQPISRGGSTVVHRFALILTALACGALAVPAGGAPPALQSHRGLDWQAPLRWVHVDNVDAAKAQAFVAARKGWLAMLRTPDGLLGDGRPLFWHARAGAVQTFFTLYPFRAWADLDARRDMVLATQKTVGDSAVATYDSGDSTLVPPHYSQIWWRSAELDVLSAGSDSLTELTGGAGRLEVHEFDFLRSDEFDRAWKTFKDALVARAYPLACRGYASVYGRGEYVLLWVAPDAARYRAAPPIAAVLAQQLGQQKSAEVLATLNQVFPLQKSYEVERRPDLSNLGR
jgi:hypothetical protein